MMSNITKYKVHKQCSLVIVVIIIAALLFLMQNLSGTRVNALKKQLQMLPSPDNGWSDQWTNGNFCTDCNDPVDNYPTDKGSNVDNGCHCPGDQGSGSTSPGSSSNQAGQPPINHHPPVKVLQP